MVLYSWALLARGTGVEATGVIVFCVHPHLSCFNRSRMLRIQNRDKGFKFMGSLGAVLIFLLLISLLVFLLVFVRIHPLF